MYFLVTRNGTLCIQMNIELSIARIYLCSNLKNYFRDTTVLESWTGAWNLVAHRKSNEQRRLRFSCSCTIWNSQKDKQPTTSNREHRKDNNSNNTTTIHNVSFCYRLADNEDNNSNNNNNLSFVLFLPPFLRLYGRQKSKSKRANINNNIIILITIN